MIIILLLLTCFSWIPPLTFTPFFEDPLKNLSQLIWPALAVGYRYSAVATRMMRSSLLEVLQEDYIRTARAKGVYERLVVARHAMRNALLPVVTVIGLEFAFLIGGLVVTEQVFNLNGIGKLFVQAVARGDYTMIQGAGAAGRGVLRHRSISRSTCCTRCSIRASATAECDASVTAMTVTHAATSAAHPILQGPEAPASGAAVHRCSSRSARPGSRSSC